MSADLPPRLTTSMVAELAGYSVRTFSRRRRTGKFLVKPCDRGAELLFPRDETLRALGILTDDTAPQALPEPPRIDAEILRAALARNGGLRGRPPASGRKPQGAIRGAGQTPALRLAFDAASAED